MRVPPQNIDAEKSVLGAILIDNKAYTDITGMITSEDFYKPLHVEIFKTIGNLIKKNEPVDIITISENLKTGEDITMYLVELMDRTPTSTNINYYAEIVESKSRLRKQILAAQNAITKAYETENPDEVTACFENGINSTNKKSLSNLYTISEAYNLYLAQLEERCNNKGAIPGKPTGFFDLDIKLGGLQDKNVYIIAARPSMGKTAFVTNMAAHISIKKKIPVPFFSLEMPKEQLVNRIVSGCGLIDSTKLKLGRLTDSDWESVIKLNNIINGSPLIIDDTAGITLNEIHAKSRRIKNQYGDLGAIIIDYLQLISPSSKNLPREQQVSEISRGLKIMAKDLNCPVLCLSQLSRLCEQRANDKRPGLSDLRESGAIEQDADVVMFLYRDEYYNPNTEKRGIGEVIIAKGRNEGTGTIELRWLGEYLKFVGLEKYREGVAK